MQCFCGNQKYMVLTLNATLSCPTTSIHSVLHSLNGICTPIIFFHLDFQYVRYLGYLERSWLALIVCYPSPISLHQGGLHFLLGYQRVLARGVLPSQVVQTGAECATAGSERRGPVPCCSSVAAALPASRSPGQTWSRNATSLCDNPHPLCWRRYIPPLALVSHTSAIVIARSSEAGQV